MIKEKQICPAYISKINSDLEKQIIFLMIPNEEKESWHYLPLNKLSALLRGVTSKRQVPKYIRKYVKPQPTFQRRINVVSTLWINVEITLI